MAFGRLERSSGAQPFSEINVTPLVDVMLVLVVIFIITAPLLTSSIQLTLPQAAAASAASAPQAVTLVIDKAGHIFLNDQPITADELKRQLGLAAARSPDTEVQLRADAAVPYGRVVEVMGLAHQAGLSRIGFVADPVAPAAPVAGPR
jgi:biopolymer transport protein TolR